MKKVKKFFKIFYLSAISFLTSMWLNGTFLRNALADFDDFSFDTSYNPSRLIAMYAGPAYYEKPTLIEKFFSFILQPLVMIIIFLLILFLGIIVLVKRNKKIMKIKK